MLANVISQSQKFVYFSTSNTFFNLHYPRGYMFHQNLRDTLFEFF